MSESNVEKLERLKNFGFLSNSIAIEDKMWLIQQTEIAQKLKAENQQYRMQYENTGAIFNRMNQRALIAENKKLREALEFYARYTKNVPEIYIKAGYYGPLVEDAGKLARAALEDNT